MASSWTDFLQGATGSGHAVQIYGDPDELAESVAAYLVAGFALGEPAAIVATPEHLTRFSERLAASGWHGRRVDRRGLLVAADAETTLASIMQGERPSPEAFERVVGGLLDQAAKGFPGCRVRVFGEMVDLLQKQGQTEAAIALEELWNGLARKRRFSLLCGYRLDVFDRSSQAATLPEICRVHSHVLPASDPVLLGRAVDLALREVLGPDRAGEVYVVVGPQVRQTRVPVAQLVLMWVSENTPALAERILASARAHYFGEPLAAATA